MGKKGILILEDGQKYEGLSVGAQAEISGEVVFNTGMTGYPEGFTDPSYCGQILVMTYPLIGNYGVPPQLTDKNGIPNYLESSRIWISGLIVSSYIDNKNHWLANSTLGEWLWKNKIPVLSGIDTRSLTKKLRSHGVLKGAIQFANPVSNGIFFRDIGKENLVAEVSDKKITHYGKGSYKILVIDCGLKVNQLKLFLNLDTTLIRVPWNFSKKYSEYESLLKSVDGVFISNGPGDPKMADVTIRTTSEIIARRIPIFGICLGNQILALAVGADTYKLTYGHRGQNQPVQDRVTGHCYVTTQNHGYAVNPKTIPKGWREWFVNLNDGTNEGIRHETMPFFSVQFHPEDTPGPTDTRWMFGYFLNQIKKYRNKN